MSTTVCGMTLLNCGATMTIDFCPWCGHKYKLDSPNKSKGEQLQQSTDSFMKSCQKMEEMFEAVKKRTLHLVFDFDGVLCANHAPTYSMAKPLAVGIKNVNKAYDLGHHVTIQTARYMRFTEQNQGASDYFGRSEAEAWLSHHGVKYHVLKFGKVSADIYVDDRGCRVESALGNTHWDQNFWPLVEKLSKEAV